MDSLPEKPLVTIGLPSYNRPDGLKRALEIAINQTYQNLEIIVSDNCSEAAMKIKEIVELYMAKDKRIKFFRHKKNIGAFLNFQFLLKNATGEYFMWLADDDERHKKCIEKSLQIIGNQGGAFGTYDLKYRYSNTSLTVNVPTILFNMPLHKRLFKFIKIFPSGYIYGLYKRAYLDFFLQENESYDFMDGYFAMYILINYGLNVQPTEYPLTTFGINEESYVPKPFKRSANKLFIYKPVVKNCCNLIRKSHEINIFYKLLLISFFLLHMIKQYITYEHPYRLTAKILNIVIRLPLRFVYRRKKIIFSE